MSRPKVEIKYEGPHPHRVGVRTEYRLGSFYVASQEWDDKIGPCVPSCNHHHTLLNIDGRVHGTIEQVGDRLFVHLMHEKGSRATGATLLDIYFDGSKLVIGENDMTGVDDGA